jgi:hypothetical protein
VFKLSIPRIWGTCDTSFSAICLRSTDLCISYLSNNGFNICHALSFSLHDIFFVFVSCLQPPPIQPADNQLSLADIDTIKVIGKGAGGIVQLVQHKWTGQFFALKVVENLTLIMLLLPPFFLIFFFFFF